MNPHRPLLATAGAAIAATAAATAPSIGAQGETA